MDKKKEIRFGAASVGKLMAGGYFEDEANRDKKIIQDYEFKKSCFERGEKMNNRKVSKPTDKQTLAYNDAKDRLSKGFSLGQGAKTYVREQWLKKEYGYRKIVRTLPMLKGHYCEQIIMDMFQECFPKFGFPRKTRDHKYDDRYIGISDFMFEGFDTVVDAKAPVDILSWFNVIEPPKLYDTQMQVYMHLYGKKKGILFYGLCDMPEPLFIQEMMKLKYMFKDVSNNFNDLEENDDYIAACNQLETNLIGYPLNTKERCKWFEFNYDPEFIEKLNTRVDLAKEYYSSLTINSMIGEIKDNAS